MSGNQTTPQGQAAGAGAPAGGDEHDRLIKASPAPSPRLGRQYGTFHSSAAEHPSPSTSTGSMPSGFQPVADQDHDDEGGRDGSKGATHIGAAPQAETYTDHDDDDAESGIGSDRTPPPPGRRFKRLTTIIITTSVLALFTVVALFLYPTLSRPSPSPAPSPSASPSPQPIPQIKILIVGDSITHGAEGDYTWRYRLWEWLSQSSSSPTSSPASLNITFVGPYTGTFPPPDTTPPPNNPIIPGLESRVWGGYAWDVSPSFLSTSSSHHFAHWGRLASQVRDVTGDMVARYQPDYLLVALGFNDLAWAHTVDETVDNMRALIGGARRAKRDVRVAVANVPQRTAVRGWKWLPGKTEKYNARLEGLVDELQEGGRVEFVRLREGYTCDQSTCPSSHDGLHPNALGEFQIAQAFSRTLQQKYGLGKGEVTIPDQIPLRPCWAPKNVRAARSVLEDVTSPILVTWDGLYGAFGYFVQARKRKQEDLEAGEVGEREVTGEEEKDGEEDSEAGRRGWGEELFTNIRRYNLFWPGDGQVWEVRVKSYCGDQQDASPWSEVVRVSA
ncbi:SGNH hydrolase-type esterase domain-containing protein [Coniochaeta sp. 2T2.1]|nr:SGNH hydrolase-type esterase domain-containing protein [Coniochaeta sp. 2T2.1]